MWSFTCIYWLSHEDKSISSCHEDGTTHEKKCNNDACKYIYGLRFRCNILWCVWEFFFLPCVNGYENFCLHLRLLWLETTALSVQSKGNNLQCLKNIKMRRQFFQLLLWSSLLPLLVVAVVVVAAVANSCWSSKNRRVNTFSWGHKNAP